MHRYDLALLTFSNTDSDMHVPAIYATAMMCPDLWQLAIKNKLHIIKDRKVWCLILEREVPASKKTICC